MWLLDNNNADERPLTATTTSYSPQRLHRREMTKEGWRLCSGSVD